MPSGESNGLAPHEPPHAPAELSDPPVIVAEHAAACVQYVLARYKIELDFTPETLPIVDQYARDARGELTARPEALDLLSATLGAYLGEVMRRQFAAFWAAEGEPASWRLMFRDVYLMFNPLGMAREAILGEDTGDWHAHLEVDPGERDLVEQRLSNAPEVAEDEYFAPSTRMEVLEWVVMALRDNMRKNGMSDVRFTEEDYAP